MSEPFVAEIRPFAFTFAPKGWAACNGQIMPISQNTALFSLLGTTFGGNGQTTFGLPDLQGRVPMHWGQGPGLSFRSLGETGGVASVTLTESQVPPHSHPLQGVIDSAGAANPAGSFLADNSLSMFARQGTPTGLLRADAITASPAAHENRMPSLAVTFAIALQGIFPPRS